MIQFNSEQHRAVMHRDGPMLVLAGPGSGKTAVIVGRVLHLVKDEHIDPHSILVLTFSRAAALQMQERFNRSAGGIYQVSFGTFHAIFYHILKSQGLYRTGEILTNNKKAQILRRISKRFGKSIHNDISGLNRMIECISYKKMGIKRLLNELNEDELSDLELLYEPYVKQCREEGMIDFDDMINDCLKMLRDNPKILKKWSDKYRYILVDEFQDIDLRQYEVLRLLSRDTNNVFCVGDDDQSIYSFRGAVPDVMKGFTEDFPGIDIVKLKLNYRCPQQVTDSAYRLISKNSHRFEKRQECINNIDKECIEFTCFRTAEEEAAYCLDIICKIIEENTGDNSNKKTTGVLYRISKSADIVEEMLKRSLISYRRKDRGEGFYDKEWIKDVLAYFRLSTDDSYEAMLRILNRPYRGLSRESMAGSYVNRSSMLSYYSEDDESRLIMERLFKDIDFIRGLNCYGALNYILKGIGMYEYIKERYFKGHPKELEDAIGELAERSRAYGSIREWLKTIDENEILDVDTKCGSNDNDDPAVELMTIHGSKGLEFDNVIMIGLQEGIFPGKHCETIEAIEEERRLFYVAMTRCRSRLWLLGRHKDDYGKRESRFLKEAGFSNEYSQISP